MEHGKKTISLAIYPVLLEILQNRPTHLYRFLQNENNRLCEYYANEGYNFRERYYRRIHRHKVLLCVVLAAVSVTMVKIETYVQASG